LSVERAIEDIFHLIFNQPDQSTSKTMIDIFGYFF